MAEHRADPLLAVCRALTPEQERMIVDGFVAVNPHWAGAEVADILDALDQTDAYLAETEPFYDANPDLAGQASGVHVAVLALICCHQLTERGVRELLAAAGDNHTDA